MIMTNGLGAGIGTYVAQLVVNHFVFGVAEADRLEGWRTCWYLFATYALVVLVLFALAFREKKTA
jgi:NHS family nucleoside permease-like MFS transporter